MGHCKIMVPGGGGGLGPLTSATLPPSHPLQTAFLHGNMKVTEEARFLRPVLGAVGRKGLCTTVQVQVS